MTDGELNALAAVVNQQTMLMAAENQDRFANCQAVCYSMSRTGMTVEAEYLRKAVMGE
jgi:hypothetical protein